MFRSAKLAFILLLGATLAWGIVAPTAHAAEVIWRVSKASGEVWIARSGVQPVALSNNETVAHGDIVRTGRNGRVLLSRGEETILVSANSRVEIAPDTKAGFSTILQKAGSILLEVEKRNVQHFEVQTPYLAAVVKGTNFRVTVEDGTSRVEVLRGQVEVKDYRSGQFALVNRDQAARVSAHGPGGLSLTGSGTLGSIQQGTPSAAPRQLRPQLDELPAVPERQPGTAQLTLRPAAPETPQKTSSDRAVLAAPERQPNKAPNTMTNEAPNMTRSGSIKRISEPVVGGRGKNQNEDATAIIAIPAIVGMTIALGVGMVRRRKRTKPNKDRC